MTWFRVDDDFESHPKAHEAGLPAVGLWTVAGSWSSRQTTDGHVPGWYVATWQARRQADRLVDAGLWLPDGDGWQMHDFLDFNPSRDRVLATRAATAERQARYRANAASNGATNASRTRGTRRARDDYPTRPDPTR